MLSQMRRVFRCVLFRFFGVDVQQHMVVIWVPLGVPGFVFRAGAIELVEIRRKIEAFGVWLYFLRWLCGSRTIPSLKFDAVPHLEDPSLQSGRCPTGTARKRSYLLIWFRPSSVAIGHSVQ